MGKIDLTAKNPFGKDMNMGKISTYTGLGLFAGAIVVLGGMVMFLKGQSGKVVKGVDGLHERLRGK